MWYVSPSVSESALCSEALLISSRGSLRVDLRGSLREGLTGVLRKVPRSVQEFFESFSRSQGDIDACQYIVLIY